MLERTNSQHVIRTGLVHAIETHLEKFGITDFAIYLPKNKGSLSVNFTV